MYYLIIFYGTALGLSTVHCAQTQCTVLKLSALYSLTVLKYSTVLNGIIDHLWITKTQI